LEIQLRLSLHFKAVAVDLGLHKSNWSRSLTKLVFLLNGFFFWECEALHYLGILELVEWEIPSASTAALGILM